MSKHKLIVEYIEKDIHLKYVDEWNLGSAVYINNIEIARNNQMFAIPFFSVINLRGKFINKYGNTVDVRVSTPHTPFLKTTTIFFNNKQVFQKTRYSL